MITRKDISVPEFYKGYINSVKEDDMMEALANNTRQFRKFLKHIPGKKINYAVSVNDKEDGSLANGKIPASQVAVSIDYLAEGYDQAVTASSQRSVDASVRFAAAKNLINKSDCRACHMPGAGLPHPDDGGSCERCHR